jgi:hypothetical protein
VAKASAKTWARAKVLHEEGKSFEEIHQELHLPSRTLKWRAKKEGWVKGRLAQELHQKEEDARGKERERLGLTKARVEAKIAQRLDAKMAVLITDSGSFSTVPLPPGVVVGEDGRADVLGGSFIVTDDAKTQDKAIDQAIDVLGMKKEILTVNPSDELRKLWALAKGAA